MILIFIDISVYIFCGSHKVKIGNNIVLFPLSPGNRIKYRGIYQLILASLNQVSDALLNNISLLSQKILELSQGFNLIRIPFGLFIYYFEKC